ncbi:NUDIX domain-containing protein [Pseudomonadota bacterium]
MNKQETKLLLVPSARGIVIENNKILLVREKEGRWHIPGGWIDSNGEPMKKCVERELYEETGLKVKAIKLLFIYEQIVPDKMEVYDGLHRIEHHFLCNVEYGKLNDSWIDHDNNLIQHRKFFSIDEIKNMKDSQTSPYDLLSNLNLEKIVTMDCSYFGKFFD